MSPIRTQVSVLSFTNVADDHWVRSFLPGVELSVTPADGATVIWPVLFCNSVSCVPLTNPTEAFVGTVTVTGVVAVNCINFDPSVNTRVYAVEDVEVSVNAASPDGPVAPVAPVDPVAPVEPVKPVLPRGMVKVKFAVPPPLPSALML